MKNKGPILFVQDGIGKITDKQRRHWKKHYKVKQKKLKSGKIVIEMTPEKKMTKRKKELIDKLSLELSKAVNSQELLKDVLDDIELKSLEKLNKSIDRGAKVKSKEGCFYLQITDKRLKKPMNLQIRK